MKPIGEGSIRKYTQGLCYRFALALWMEHGKKHRIAVFTSPDSKYAHACLEYARGVYIDVEGVHKGTRKTARYFGFTEVKFWEGDDIDLARTLRRKDYPDDIRKAKWLIRRNRERYLLTR
jgi:hypothetical protein